MKWEAWNRDRIDDLVELWNKEIGDLFPMRRELFEQNSFDDVNVDWQGSLVALDDERVVGFVVVKRWQDPVDVGMSENVGWIQVLLVDQDVRGQGIGTGLLKHAEEQLMNKGIHRILLGRDTWHYFPGIPKEYKDVCEWFERKGYVASWEEVDLYCEYVRASDVEIPVCDGIEVVLATESDRDGLVTFLHRCFPGRWEYEAIKYFEKGGSGREFVLLKKDSNIIGFCRINDGQSPFIAQNTYWAPLVDGELGGVGPLGVDREERKNGYGFLVVEAGIAYLRQRGVKSIVIDWTGLVDFYKKFGFDVWKRYVSYEKKDVIL